MKLSPILFGIARAIFTVYYSARWKIRYATKIFGIEHIDDAAQKAWNYDRERFVRYASTALVHTWPFSVATTDAISKNHFRAILTKNYHTVEKAMALPEPRPDFGQKSGLIDKCIADCTAYIGRFGHDDITRTTYDVLSQYVQSFGKGYAPAERFLAEHPEDNDNVRTGGTQSFDASEIPSNVDERFFATRHSIRHFSPEPVSQDIIKQAVRYAQFGTPSVCNRQPGHVRVLSSAQEKKSVLALQNGNKGFGDSASHILIITSDLESFVDVGERNQCWISGGMFAMSLVYALHAQKIATCALNWDVLPENDKALHTLARIPPSEVIVMMIAIGHYPATVQVTCSERKKQDAILHLTEDVSKG